MIYLLIDFGASYIKSATYEDGLLSDTLYTDSPFVSADKLQRDTLISLLENIAAKYPVVHSILGCSLKGGKWENDTYHSWKCSIGYDTLFEGVTDIDGIPFYDAGGDTDCVKAGANLSTDDVLVNIGTGSQVITNGFTTSYIPAGRALLVFDQFFTSMGLDFFALLQTVTSDQVCNSTLTVDLNVFPQSKWFDEGGSISCIMEGEFNLKNLLASIISSLVLQYVEPIKNTGAHNIILVGGIPKKLPIIKELFKWWFPECTVTLYDGEATFAGMIKQIR